MVRSAGCVRLLVRVCRINRRRRPRRWMSSSTRCPTILTHLGWYCCQPEH